jgi:hypothetical protein
MCMDFPAVGFGIEVLLERILGNPTLEAWAGQLAALEQRSLVVACPAVATGARLTDVAGEHEREVGGSVGFGGMEPMVDAFALMNRGRAGGRDIFGQSFDQLPRSARHLGNTVEIVVSQMNAVEIPRRRRVHHGAIGKFDPALPVKSGCDSALGQCFADHVPGDRLGRVRGGIPDDKVPDLTVLIVGDSLDLLAGTVLRERGGVVREDIGRSEPLTVVGTDQEWEIREADDERLVVPAIVHHEPRHP